MKKVILYLILIIPFSLMCLVACDEAPCGCAPLTTNVSTNIRAYGILKEGMSIHIVDTTLLSSDSIVFDINLLDLRNGDYSGKSFVYGDQKWLYPGVPCNMEFYWNYDVVPRITINQFSNRDAFVPYWELSASFGDTVDKTVSHSLYDGVIRDMKGGFAALSNKLNSIELVCINREVAGIEPNNSLASLTLFEAQQFHKVEGIGYTLNTLVNSNLPPYEVSHRLSEFKNYNGYTLLNIATLNKRSSSNSKYKLYLPWRFTIARGAGDAPFSGDYRFKLVFYFDDGALTIESNEFTVSVEDGA